MIGHFSGVIALVAIVTCVAAPALYFFGSVSESTYLLVFCVASLVYFASAVVWISQRKKS
jgi:hypothetical protein